VNHVVIRTRRAKCNSGKQVKLVMFVCIYSLQRYPASRAIGLAVGGVSTALAFSYTINPAMHAQSRKEKVGQ
jgi:hypothetical protein